MDRVVILAEDNFSWQNAKTAVGLLRYRADNVVAILDSTHAGEDAAQALGDPEGLGRGIPVVANIQGALTFSPDTLLIGISPPGGRLPDAWRAQVLEAMARGMNIVSGLHSLLGDDPELAAAAQRHHVRIWDVRRPPDELALRIRAGTPHRLGSHTICFCGTDCSVGKMTAALEFDREAQRRGLSSAFAATGQTGIMISGRGIPVDRFISDFVAGAVEAMVLEFTDAHDWVFIEGQGALGHPAYSAVTLGLLHGSAPDLLVLCHQAGRTQLLAYDTPLPTLVQARAMYETAAAWLKPAPMACLALNTLGMPESAARAAIEEAERELGLPTSDPVRFGASPLLDALLARV